MQDFASTPRVTLEIGRGGLASIPDLRLQSLAEYWFERRHGGCVPPRAAIDPLDFPGLLPNIMLLDRLGTPPQERYRFRLTGTDVVAHAGKELTGRYIDDVLPGSYHDYVRLLNRTALQEGLPVYSSSLYHDQGNFVNSITYRLIMPLTGSAGSEANNCEAGAMIFVCQFWQRREQTGFWRGDWRRVMPEIRVIDPAL